MNEDKSEIKNGKGLKSGGKRGSLATEKHFQYQYNKDAKSNNLRFGTQKKMSVPYEEQHNSKTDATILSDSVPPAKPNMYLAEIGDPVVNQQKARGGLGLAGSAQKR